MAVLINTQTLSAGEARPTCLLLKQSAQLGQVSRYSRTFPLMTHPFILSHFLVDGPLGSISPARMFDLNYRLLSSQFTRTASKSTSLFPNT